MKTSNEFLNIPEHHQFAIQFSTVRPDESINVHNLGRHIMTVRALLLHFDGLF